MFKTILSKLLVLFISIIIISISITGVMLFYLLNDYVYAEKEDLLIRNAEAVSDVWQYLSHSDDPLAMWAFEQSLKQCQRQTSSSSIVWVVGPAGNIWISQPDMSDLPRDLRRKLTDESGQLHLPDKRQYSKVMLNGGRNVVKEKGDFYGLFEGQSYLIVEKPLIYTDDSGNEKIAAAVYLSLPMPEVYGLQWSIFRFFMISVGVSILIATVLAYVFSNRISRPLKEINNAARVIASGEFDKRLDINSRDEIGELANSFNNMVTSLQNLEEMRRGFIANVSHELRTPMTSIRGFVEGIMDGTIPRERQKYYLSIVRDEVNRMNRLVNNLLDLARMEAGEVNLKKVDFNINELIRRVIIKVETLILQKNIEVEAVFEIEDIYVNADIDAIERVILNLVHNAVKFTPEGGKIILGTSNRRGRIHVSVEDNGIGIGKDEINLIWDRFYKSDKSRSRDKSGTGLGLAIVKNIISEHGQEIWVESEPGKGTKFTFTLDKPEEKNV